MDNDQQFKLELIINGAKDDMDKLTEWEQNFLISLEERYNEWGDRTRISDKQWVILDRIYDKVV